jgi:hypothetical protein
MTSNSASQPMFRDQQINKNSILDGKSACTVVLGIGAFAIGIYFTGYIGRYLWNNVLVDVVPGVKKMDVVWKFIGLMVLFGILFRN